MRRLRTLVIVLGVCVVGAGVVAGVLFVRQRLAGPPAAASIFPTVAATCPASEGAANALDQVAPGAGGAQLIGGSNRGIFGGLARGAAGATPSPVPSAHLACRTLAPAIVSQFAALDEAGRQLGTDGYDETVRGGELADANAVFTYVRDRIRTQAYAGAMRGGLGALMSRGGSPDDKALLLAQLLGTKGIPVRFVHANLSGGEIAAVISAMLAQPQSPPNPPAPVAQDYQNELAAAQPFIAQVTQALAKSNVALASSDAALRARWAANLRDHWWVQAREGGNWVDLDPTMPNARPGTHLGAAPTDPPAIALPSALYPVLAFRVIADYTSGGTVTTQTLLATSARTADAYAQPITIRIGDPSATLGTLVNSTSFAAYIAVGGNSSTSAAFQADPPNGPRLLRLRLEIETDRPGYAPLVQSQTIVDRSDASGMAVDPSWTAQRTAYALTTNYYGIAAAGDLDPQFLAMREVQGADELQAVLGYLANGQRGAPPAGAQEAYPLPVMRFFESDELLRALINAKGGTEFFFNRPTIAFVHRVLDWDGSHLIARNDFDIAESAMDVDGSNESAAVADNLARGIIENADEAELAMAVGAHPVTTRVVFARAGSTAPVVAVAPSAAPPPLPAFAAAAIGDSLERGAVVAVMQPVRVGDASHVAWWEIDPQSGSTIGRMESGAGQAEVEYVRTSDVAAAAVDHATLVSDFDLCLLGESVGVLAKGGSMAGAPAKCEAQALCNATMSAATGGWANWLYGEGGDKLASILAGLTGLYAKLCG
ncbi:MAG: hypothetical protein ACYDEW_00965 [Vulcanimicrobiaceae bacterium]